MTFISALIHLIHHESGEEGQGLAEYGLVIALIAVVAIVALTFVGNAIAGNLSTIGSSISR